MNRWRLAGMAGAGVWLLAHVAAAQSIPERVALRWSAPEVCPDDVRLVHRIEALLGQRLSEAGEQTLSVNASVLGSEANGFAAKLTFTSPRGTEQRFLEHPKCDSLTEAVALVVALTIDPERVRATQLAAEKERETLLPPPAPRPVETAAPPVSPRRGEPSGAPVLATEPLLHGARFALHATVGAGPLPRLGPGVEATLGWHRGSFRAEVIGRYWLPRSEALAIAPSSSVRVELETLGGRGCWLTPAGAWALAACAGMDVGDQSATGVLLQNGKTQHAALVDLAGGLQLAYRRWPLMPEGGFEISGALARPQFGVVQDGRGVPVYEPAAWGFSAFLGLAFEL